MIDNMGFLFSLIKIFDINVGMSLKGECQVCREISVLECRALYLSLPGRP